MNKQLVTLLLTAAMFAAGCSDKEARDYATKLIPVLDSYQAQLNQKIKAEQEAYGDLADTYAQAEEDDVKIRLQSERLNRSEVLGADFADSQNPPKLAQILAPLQDYAKLDFETTQVLLDEQMDARSKYLTDLEGLEIELAKIKALKEALQGLEKGKSGFKKFQDMGAFVASTEDGANKLFCADLKKQLDQLNADDAALKGKLDAVDADKKALQTKIDKIEQKIAQVTERRTAHNCS